MKIVLNEEEKAMLQEIEGDDELAENFVQEILYQIETDDECPIKKGKKLARHLLEGSVCDVLMDMCGWTVQTLYKFAKDRVQVNREIAEEAEGDQV